MKLNWEIECIVMYIIQLLYYAEASLDNRCPSMYANTFSKSLPLYIIILNRSILFIVSHEIKKYFVTHWYVFKGVRLFVAGQFAAFTYSRHSFYIWHFNEHETDLYSRCSTKDVCGLVWRIKLRRLTCKRRCRYKERSLVWALCHCMSCLCHATVNMDLKNIYISGHLENMLQAFFTPRQISCVLSRSLWQDKGSRSL